MFKRDGRIVRTAGMRWTSCRQCCRVWNRPQGTWLTQHMSSSMIDFQYSIVPGYGMSKGFRRLASNSRDQTPRLEWEFDHRSGDHMRLSMWETRKFGTQYFNMKNLLIKAEISLVAFENGKFLHSAFWSIALYIFVAYQISSFIHWTGISAKCCGV